MQILKILEFLKKIENLKILDFFVAGIAWNFFCCMDSMEFLCCMDVHFFRMVYIKFHTKSWVCSSKNGWVIANFMVHGIFLAWISMQIFLCIDAHFFGWSIQTSMRNPESVAQKMSELYLIPWSMEFFLHGFHANFSLHGCPFCRDGPYELPCEIWSL